MNSNKKILILKRDLTKIGGLEKYTLKTAQILAEEGYEVTLLTTKNTETISSDVKIKTVRTAPSFLGIIAYDRIAFQFQQENPFFRTLSMERTSFQTHLRAGEGSHLAYLERRKKIEKRLKNISFKINPRHRTILTLEKKAFESPHLVRLITNSNMVKEEILNYYSTPPEKIRVIHNGVEWEQMKNDFSKWPKKKKEILRSLHLKEDTFNFLFIGNGFKRKGLDIILNALSLLKKSMFHLLIVGKDKKINRYKKMVSKLKLGSKVTFFGIQKNIRDFYMVSDCLLLPSFYDPFANVTLEALAMGLYVITSRSNGAHEIISQEKGTIIEDLLSDEIVEAIENVLEKPKDMRSAQLIRNSVQHLDFSKKINDLISAII